MPRKHSLITTLGGGFILSMFALAVGAALYKALTPAAAAPPPVVAPVVTAKPPAQPAIEGSKTDVQASRALRLASLLKTNANDPESFELVQALVTDAGGVCLRVRARNGFGALMLQDLAMDRADKQSTWKAACNPQQKPRDVTHIKHFIT